nr:reverse transcriptase domain-containing protein [Tanacetum cinerariifolium]
MANDPNNVQGPPPVGPNFQNPNPDLCPMEELLHALTDGVGDAIVVPSILSNQFELKIGLLNLVNAIAFHGFENDNPHSHIRRFTKITQTVKLNNVPSNVVKLLLFSFSLEGAARTWLDKEPPNSIITWNDLVSKFVNRSSFIETSDSLLEEFADELALFDSFPSGNKDDNFDPEADLREIEYLLNRNPLTDSSPTNDFDIIDPIPDRIIDEPDLIYSSPSGNDDDDLLT